MPRGASTIALASVVCALTLATPAVPQTEKREPSLSLDYYLVLYLGNEELHKELGLKPEVVKKLTTHRQSWMSEYLSAARTDRKRLPEIARENTRALGEMLSATELKRLREIALQQIAGDRPPLRVRLGEVREIVEGLNLTLDQRDKMSGGARFEDVLTEDQKPKWKAMLGEPTKLVLRPALGGRPASPPLPPRCVYYLESESVRKDLGLKGDPADTVARLKKAWAGATKDYPDWKPEERAAKVEEASAALAREIAESLTPAQVKRLRQIEMQEFQQMFADLARYYTHQRIAPALNFTGDQADRIKKLARDRAVALGPLFLSGKKHDAIAADVAAHKKKTEEMMRAVLTEEQRRALAELTGPDFGWGPYGLIRPISVVSIELDLMGSSDLATELGLDADRVKGLRELSSRYRTEWAEAASAELREKYSKLLDAALPPETRKRFREVALQQTLKEAGDLYGGSRVIEVEKELNVSEGQRLKLERGEPLEQVLTGEQKKAWRAMLGKKLEQPLTPYIPPSSSGPTPAPRAILRHKEIQDELKMTDEQKKARAGLVEAWQEAVKDYRDWDPARRAEKVAALRKDFDARAEKILDPAQNGRLDQIMLQRGLVLWRFGDPDAARAIMSGPRRLVRTETSSLELVLRYRPAVKELGLTEKQQARVRELTSDADQTRYLFQEELDGEATAGYMPRQEYAKLRTDFGRSVEEKLKAVLTPEQQKKLKEMMGEPFTAPLGPQRGHDGPAFEP